MGNNENDVIIVIDTERSVFHFYLSLGGKRKRLKNVVKNYTGRPFTPEFYDKFKLALHEFMKQYPSKAMRKATVLLPDSAVLMDMVKVPTMRGFGQTQKALNITMNSLYRNVGDLKLVSQQMAQNRQYTTYSVFAIQKHIATELYSICTVNKVVVETLTFVSSATIAAATLLNPKLKNDTYLFLDLKDITTRMIFVAKGRVIGSYILPFGHSLLAGGQVVPEDMLFDHSYAELAVLNARERAKSKKLTVMEPETEQEQEDFEDLPSQEERAQDASMVSDENPPARPAVKYFSRKAPRRLPKYLRRDIPETPEGVLYENFRVFVKWALTLIAENGNLTEVGRPKYICVNMPDSAAFVLDIVNEEQEENGFEFIALSGKNEYVSQMLEAFGGLNPKQINKGCKF